MNEPHKLRLHLCSDLHGEFTGYTYQLPKLPNIDAYVLDGDIGTGLFGVEWAVREAERLGIPIIYIFGNHDYYKNNLDVINQAKEYIQNTGVIILENDVIELKGYRILGCTLFTDYRLHGPTGEVLARMNAPQFMSDHTYIKNSNGTIFTPADAYAIFEQSFKWLQDNLTGLRDIVFTHHAPVHQGISPQYRGDVLSPCFASDCEGFILDRQPLLWGFGHTHHNIDIMVGNTRVISNCKGYKNEGVANFQRKLIIEV